MAEASPLLSQIFYILAKQGWRLVAPELPRYRQRGLSDGFMVVSDTHVTTSGVLPQRSWSHLEFVAQNTQSLFRN